MQWRPVILFLSGVITIYISSLLQHVPHPHPKEIHAPQQPFHTVKPIADYTVLTVIGDFAYFTMVYYQVPTKPVVGSEKLKLGVEGVVRQLRKPVEILTETGADEDWTESFFHTLDGQISSVSQREQDILVLYHVVQDDTVKHYARIYSHEQNKYRHTDILLPGSTWIDSIRLEKDSILLSRNPDEYQFQWIPLPKVTGSSVVIKSTHYGQRIEKTFPDAVEHYPVTLSKLYSPLEDTYRVLIHRLYKTESKFNTLVSIVDGMIQDSTYWREQARTENNHTIYYDEAMNNQGYADATLNDRINNVRKRPKIFVTSSTDSKTIVFPFVGNSFFSFDFTDRIDILRQMSSEKKYLYARNPSRTEYLDEYYYQRGYELDTDADIAGIELNPDASRMAVWTDQNTVYIYGRYNETLDAENQNKSFLQKGIDFFFMDDDEKERRLYRHQLPLQWKTDMAIIPKTSASVGQVKFYQKYILVVYTNGYIYSYCLNEMEEQRPVNFLTFINDKWDMLIVMCAIIATFVYNEFQRI
ncbi:hypothetical protein BY458DRAFT_207021 [Sporodiniella umbellata]|nr:hypothetical protein BY458DRAFT_207021 [Sporodiniella umbellata]